MDGAALHASLRVHFASEPNALFTNYVTLRPDFSTFPFRFP